MTVNSRSFGTGWLRTRIDPAPGGGYMWRHQPGPSRPGRIPVPDEAFTRACEQASVRAPAILTCPVRDGAAGARWARLPGATTLAELISSHGRIAPSGAGQYLADVGATLTELHRIPCQVAPERIPPGPGRLARWLDTNGAGPGAALTLYQSAERTLGPERLGRLRSWCRIAAQAAPGGTVHGHFSLGEVVIPEPAADEARLAVLTGEDAARGPAEADLGWMIGELYEYRCLAAAQGMNTPHLKPMREALRAGYGLAVHDDRVAQYAVLRLAVHTHDYAAFVGWSPELYLYLSFLQRAIDDPGDTLAGWSADRDT